jgi:hypothetical protein
VEKLNISVIFGMQNWEFVILKNAVLHVKKGIIHLYSVRKHIQGQDIVVEIKIIVILDLNCRMNCILLYLCPFLWFLLLCLICKLICVYLSVCVYTYIYMYVPIIYLIIMKC